MKKIFTLIMAIAIVSATQAQIFGTKKWSQELTTVTDAADLYTNAPAAVTTDGSVITTGTFTQSLTIGQTTLEPIATSAYIAKFNANGEATWAVALQGSATIKSIDTDEKGNIYVAGQFADIVIVGSTDGNTKEIVGKEGVTAQVTAFVAKYDADGKVQAVKTINAVADADLAASGLYFPFDEDLKITIKKIQAADNKLYISLAHMGNVNIDEMAWKGTCVNVFDFMYMDIESMGIIAMSAENLNETESIAHVASATNLDYNQMQPEDINFTIDGTTVYMSFVGIGNLTLATKAGNNSFQFAYDGMGTNEHGYVVAAIDGAATTTKIFNATAHTSSAAYNEITEMVAYNNSLYMAGTFIGNHPMDTIITSKGLCDVYVASINKSDLSVNYVANSNVEENIDAEGNSSMSIYESVTGILVKENAVTLTTCIQSASEGFVSATVYNVADGEIKVDGNEYVTSLAANGEIIATVNNNNTTSTVTVYTSGDATGIDAIDTENEETVIFDITGRKINTVTTPGIYIVNGKKVIIK